MKSICILILVFVSFNINGQTNKVFKKDNIHFEYPSHWIIRDFPNYYILVSEPPKDVVSVMTTFDIEVNDTIKSLKKFCNEYEKKMKENDFFRAFNIFLKVDFKFKNFDAIHYNCTATVQNIPVEWEMVVFLSDKKIYQLTMTSREGILELISEDTKIIWNSFDLR